MRQISDDLRLRFAAAAACWGAGLLLLLRSPFGERAIVAPFVAWQAMLVSRGSAASPITVDARCSASDILALSAAIMLAYPVSWRRRLWGVAGGVLWVVTLNLVRLITLTNAVGTPLFGPLHLYVWPAILIAAATAFVFTWMWVNERDTDTGADAVVRWRSLTIATAALLTGYVIVAPLLLQAEALRRASMMMADGAAWVLGAIGVDALTGGSTLVVGQRSFLVTPECIVSPLMPVYLAWGLTWPSRVRTRAVALSLFLPLFLALGFVRLLTVALPALIGPALFLTHGFYQLLLGALIIAGTARARAVATGEPPARALAYAALASALALAVARPYTASIVAAGHALRALLSSGPLSTPAADLQGAIAILPAYQWALLCGVTVAWFGPRGWRPLRVLAPIAACMQIAAVALSEIAPILTETPTLIRAFSIAVPCVLVAIAAVRRRQKVAPAAWPVELRA